MAQLKQDMSTLRQEVMSSLYRQDKERSRMATRVSHIETGLATSRDLFQRQHMELREDNETKVSELKSEMHLLDAQMREFQTGVTRSFADVQRQMAQQLRETRLGMEILKDSMYRMCADVSALRGRGALSQEILIQQSDDVTADGDQGLFSNSQDIGARLLGDHGSRSMTGNVAMDGAGTHGNYGPITVTARRVVIEK